MMGREGKLEEREKAAQSMQADALALKTDLQSLAKAMQGQADRQVSDAAEEKQALARHQARLDTLQVCCACKHPPAACHSIRISPLFAPWLYPLRTVLRTSQQPALTSRLCTHPTL